MRAAALVAGVAIPAAVLTACDGGATEPPFLPEESPTPTAGATARTTATAAPDIGSYDDPFDFRSLAAQLDDAIATADVQFFLDNVTFEDVSCEIMGIPGPPESCAGQPPATTMPGILLCVMQSECSYLGATGYEQFVSELLTNIADGASDAYGDARLQLYAYAVRRPEFQISPTDIETVEAIATRIAGPMSEKPLVPGQPLQRGVLLFAASFDGQRWTITRLTVGPVGLLDPTGREGIEAGVDGLFQFWERWEGTP